MSADAPHSPPPSRTDQGSATSRSPTQQFSGSTPRSPAPELRTELVLDNLGADAWILKEPDYFEELNSSHESIASIESEAGEEAIDQQRFENALQALKLKPAARETRQLDPILEQTAMALKLGKRLSWVSSSVPVEDSARVSFGSARSMSLLPTLSESLSKSLNDLRELEPAPPRLGVSSLNLAGDILTGEEIQPASKSWLMPEPPPSAATDPRRRASFASAWNYVSLPQIEIRDSSFQRLLDTPNSTTRQVQLRRVSLALSYGVEFSMLRVRVQRTDIAHAQEQMPLPVPQLTLKPNASAEATHSSPKLSHLFGKPKRPSAPNPLSTSLPSTPLPTPGLKSGPFFKPHEPSEPAQSSRAFEFSAAEEPAAASYLPTFEWHYFVSALDSNIEQSVLQGLHLHDLLTSVNGRDVRNVPPDVFKTLLTAPNLELTLEVRSLNTKLMADVLSGQGNRLSKIASFFGESMHPDRSSFQRGQRRGLLEVKYVSKDDGKKMRKRVWRKMSCSLRGQLLQMSDIDELQSGIADADVISIAAAMCDIAYDYKKRKDVFRLTTITNAQYLCQAQNSADMLAWIKAIQDAAQIAMNTDPEIFKRVVVNSGKYRDPGPPKVQTTKSTFSLMGRFKRRQSASTLEPKPPSSQPSSSSLPKRDRFLLTIEAACELDEVPCPLVLTKCITEIERRGVGFEGIYRLTASTLLAQKLRDCLAFAPREVNLQDEQTWSDGNAICGVLKMYIRGLPEPVLTTHLYNEFIDIGRSKNKMDRVGAIKALVHSLPITHYNTLEFLIRHLVRVMQHSATNKMEVKNLAIVFGPTLVSCSSMDPMALMHDMAHQCSAVELLILNADEIFTREQPVDRIDASSLSIPSIQVQEGSTTSTPLDATPAPTPSTASRPGSIPHSPSSQPKVPSALASVFKAPLSSETSPSAATAVSPPAGSEHPTQATQAPAISLDASPTKEIAALLSSTTRPASTDLQSLVLSFRAQASSEGSSDVPEPAAPQGKKEGSSRLSSSEGRPNLVRAHSHASAGSCESLHHALPHGKGLTRALSEQEGLGDQPDVGDNERPVLAKQRSGQAVPSIAAMRGSAQASRTASMRTSPPPKQPAASEEDIESPSALHQASRPSIPTAGADEPGLASSSLAIKVVEPDSQEEVAPLLTVLQRIRSDRSDRPQSVTSVRSATPPLPPPPVETDDDPPALPPPPEIPPSPVSGSPVLLRKQKPHAPSGPANTQGPPATASNPIFRHASLGRSSKPSTKDVRSSQFLSNFDPVFISGSEVPVAQPSPLPAVVVQRRQPAGISEHEEIDESMLLEEFSLAIDPTEQVSYV
eukprot:m.444260 g.444260  ORF g.444260 m.444260 type:complete len:1322 (+) comp56833_c0_seq2:91-4056(+)